MLPLAGQPLLAHTLRYLARHGYDQIAINLHHGAACIREHFGDRSTDGQAIHYFAEASLLGTAGTVKSVTGFLGQDDDLLVVYGDLLVDQDLGALRAAHRRNQAAATLLLHRRSSSNSVVQMDPDGRITAFIERPSERDATTIRDPWVNSGLQLLGRRFLQRIPDEIPVDLPRDVYAPNVAYERLYGFALTGYRCAIDSPARYAEAQEAIASGKWRG